MKKRVLSIVCAGLIALSAAACSSTGVSEEEYQSLLDENSALQAQIEELEAELAATPEPTPIVLSVSQQFRDVSFSIPDTWEIPESEDPSTSKGYFPRNQKSAIVSFYFSPNVSFDQYRESYEADFESVEGASDIQGKEITLMGNPALYVTCNIPMQNRMGNTENYFTYWNIFEISDGIALVSLGVPESEEDAKEQYIYEYEAVVESFKLTPPTTSSALSTPVPTSTPAPTPAPESSAAAPTSQQSAALSTALDYLDFTAFSHSGLVDQLEYEGFSTEDATWAADNCGADWDQQALQSAKDYLDFTAFSYSGLIDQLEYEGFTTEQATYGVDNCGADWMEQAALCAQEYLDYSDFSRQDLIDQLEFEGFTAEQAQYGVTQAGM